MHIYAFGSVCRGEITQGSDVDLLAVTQGHDARFDPNIYSIYSYERLSEIWSEGNPFAWHLALEAKMLHSDDGSDYLRGLGTPEPYRSSDRDCLKFFKLFQQADHALRNGSNSPVFELSTVFLAIRNFATCYSLGRAAKPDFSRNSALRLGGESIPLDYGVYSTLERARVLCTRGAGEPIADGDIRQSVLSLDVISKWMTSLLNVAEVA